MNNQKMIAKLQTLERMLEEEEWEDIEVFLEDLIEELENEG